MRGLLHPEEAFKSGVSSLFGNQVSVVYIFWRDSSGAHYKRFASDDNINNPLNSTLVDLIQISPFSGGGSAGQQMLVYQREKNAQAFYIYKYAESRNSLVGSATIRVVPRVQAPFSIPLHLSSTSLQQRRQEMIKAFALNADATPSILAYLRETYYFVPLQLALALQSGGYYLASLDCFRTIYDYEAQMVQPSQRNIFYGLELDAKLPDTSFYQQADGWLLDPLNPHLIASTRRYAYTRFTLICLVRCLLEYADSEFTQETGESLAKARTLYLTALELCNLPVLQQKLGVCDDLIAELKIEPGKDIPPEVPAAVGSIQEDLTAWGHSNGNFAEVVKDVNAKLKGVAGWDEKLDEARSLVQEAIAKVPLLPLIGGIVSSKRGFLQEKGALLISDAAINQKAQDISKKVAAGVLAGLKPAVLPGAGITPQGPPPPSLPPVIIAPSLQFCIPPNPIMKALRLHAELNLYKLRTCRNIAGMKRQLDPYAAPTDTTSGLPVIGAGGQLNLPSVTAIRPSLYHERILRDRAKALVQVAAQVETAMVAALEKGAAERYTMFKARQELRLAQTGVRLQSLRVTRADHGVKLAELQQERANIQVNTYEEWISAGLNQYGEEMLIRGCRV